MQTKCFSSSTRFKSQWRLKLGLKMQYKSLMCNSCTFFLTPRFLALSLTSLKCHDYLLMSKYIEETATVTVQTEASNSSLPNIQSLIELNVPANVFIYIHTLGSCTVLSNLLTLCTCLLRFSSKNTEKIQLTWTSHSGPVSSTNPPLLKQIYTSAASV